jgi:hypothetical protein
VSEHTQDGGVCIAQMITSAPGIALVAALESVLGQGVTPGHGNLTGGHHSACQRRPEGMPDLLHVGQRIVHGPVTEDPLAQWPPAAPWP